MAVTIEIDGHVGKIGLCTDVHGNITNLFAMVTSRPDIAHWFCAGDVVDMDGKVYNNRPTVAFMRKQGIHAVMGNHDRYVIQKRIGEFEDPEDRRFLTELPLDLTVLFEDMTIRVYHATPRDLEEFIGEETPDYLFRTCFFRAAAGKADVIVLGHNHRAFSKTVDQTRFVNPGYLGARYGAPTYCTLSRDGSFEHISLE